jgi:voltage-gated sodium channel
MSESDLLRLEQDPGVPEKRLRLARWVESAPIQKIIVAVILANSVILGFETNAALMASHGVLLKVLDKLCLLVFVAELGVKLFCYRRHFWKSGWNLFDFAVVAIALAPGAGTWAVLRSLRVLRVLRLLTVVPGLRKVVAAFLHAIPGLSGVMAVMAIFFYTAGVLATKLFGVAFPDWFGTLGRSLYTLFQVMTLESWSMGIVRPVMEVFPWAWAFFVPFIIIATFTILNLFIGIIVSTMQELAMKGEKNEAPASGEGQEEMGAILGRMEADLAALRTRLENPLGSGGNRRSELNL